MTKDEAAKIWGAARRWAACAHVYGLGTVDYSRVTQREKELLALLGSMEDPKIAADPTPKITYITRCPACHAKIEWDESGTNATAKTPADIAHENTQCNTAYFAKKTE